MTADPYMIAEALAQAGVTPTEPVPTDAPAAAQPDPQVPPTEPAAYDGDDISDFLAPDAAGMEEQQTPSTPPAVSPAASVTPEMASLIHQNQVMLQQHFAAQTAQNEQRVKELEARLASYEQDSQPAAKAWYEEIDVPSLTEEQKAQYAGSLPVIEAIARAQAVEIAKRMQQGYIDQQFQQFQQTLQPLQENVNVSAQQAALAQQQMVRQTLSSRLPWLTKEVRDSAEYSAYYNSVIPNTGGLTRKVLVEQANAAGNVDAIVDLLSGFKPANQNTAQYVAPGRNHTAAPTTADAPPPRKGMKLSTYNQALKDYASGKISATKFQEYETAWYNAMSAGTAVVDE